MNSAELPVEVGAKLPVAAAAVYRENRGAGAAAANAAKRGKIHDPVSIFMVFPAKATGQFWMRCREASGALSMKGKMHIRIYPRARRQCPEDAPDTSSVQENSEGRTMRDLIISSASFLLDRPIRPLELMMMMQRDGHGATAGEDPAEPRQRRILWSHGVSASPYDPKQSHRRSRLCGWPAAAPALSLRIQVIVASPFRNRCSSGRGGLGRPRTWVRLFLHDSLVPNWRGGSLDSVSIASCSPPFPAFRRKRS